MNMKVICLIVDAMGIGQMSDAAPTDCPANTVSHVCQYGRPIHVPNFEKLGLGNIVSAPCIRSVGNLSIASYGKMELGYDGADTYMGHQILMGTGALIPDKKTIRQLGAGLMVWLQEQGHSCQAYGGPGIQGPLVVDGCVYVADCMEAAPGLSINITASLRQTGIEHVMEVAHLVRQAVPVTRVIVVASDVFGDAEIHRSMVSRSNGSVGVDTPKLCLLDEKVVLRHLGLPLNLDGQCPPRVAKLGVPVYLIGKAADVIQCHEPSCTSISMVDSKQIFSCVKDVSTRHEDALVVANIQETDLSGHSQDILRWADLLELVDSQIPELLELIGPDGAFLLSGDHGNDPYMGKGQHTREMTPCLFYSRRYRPADLGVRKTLADVGATISDLFHAGPTEGGTSVLKSLGRMD